LAQDWSQETLLRAWKDFVQLKDHRVVYAWLLKILNRVIADDIRRTSRRNQIAPVINVDDDNITAHPCSAPGPFAQTLAQQSQTQLQLAILQLPDDFRTVILLRDTEGMSYDEIANTLELVKGTVMSRLSRGRRLLSSYLLKQQGNETPLTKKTRQNNDQ